MASDDAPRQSALRALVEAALNDHSSDTGGSGGIDQRKLDFLMTDIRDTIALELDRSWPMMKPSGGSTQYQHGVDIGWQAARSAVKSPLTIMWAVE